ncbi:MAG: glycerophosphodiester phosphodiesterase family protein [Pseudomonadota bacterium]
MTPPLPAAFLAAPLAHRARHDGTGNCPENSLSAIRAAVREGYGIEVDLQLSASGDAIVFHDATLARLAGDPRAVRDVETAELRGMALLDGSDLIPTLSDCLAEIAGRVPILIEIKDQDRRLGPAVGPLEAATARALEGYEGPAAVMSFNPHSVAEMARLAPDTPRGLTSGAFSESFWPDVSPTRRAALAELSDFESAGARFISHDWRALSNPAVAALKAQGVPILCWTVRSAEDERAARTVADQITFEGYTPA